MYTHDIANSIVLTSVYDNTVLQVFVVDYEALLTIQHTIKPDGSMNEMISIKRADNRWYIYGTTMELKNAIVAGPLQCRVVTPMAPVMQMIVAPAIMYHTSVDWRCIKRRIWRAMCLTQKCNFVLKRRR